MKTRPYMLAALLLGLQLPALADPPPQMPFTQAPRRQEPMVVMSITLTPPSDRVKNVTRFVAGTVKSYSENIVQGTITFELWDAKGQMVGTATDTIHRLKAHGSWQYRAMFSNDSVVKATLGSLIATPQ